MEQQKSSKGMNVNLKSDDEEGQPQKNLKIGQEKTSLTSYSFARHNEEPNSASSPTSPPPLKDQPGQQNFVQLHPQMVQHPPGQYSQMPPGMMINYGNQQMGHLSGVYPPLNGPKPVLTSSSPTDPRLVFNDMQFMVDSSPANTPGSQIDPSPTAEALIPGFLKDEIDNKNYSFPNATQEVRTKDGSNQREIDNSNDEDDFEISNYDAPQPKSATQHSNKMNVRVNKQHSDPIYNQNMSTHPMSQSMQEDPQNKDGRLASNYYGMGYQPMGGYMPPPMYPQYPGGHNMQGYISGPQYGYMGPQYPNPYYGQAPSNEYLEQRRISMPLNYYSSGLDQHTFSHPPPQYRSNSLADPNSTVSMNFNQPGNRNQNVQNNDTAPPGLMKGSQRFKDGQPKSGTLNQISSGGDPQTQNQINSDFAQMSLGRRPPHRSHKPNTLMAATGEISCHSNSTIKEEEFDSEREANERESDSSSNNPSNSGQYDQNIYADYRHQNKKYYQGLLDDDMIRGQKRRESQQIPATSSLEEKRQLKSPMKSSAMAFVPKTKDNRTSSMPNIFQPFGTKGENYHPGMQDNRGYYQYDPRGNPQQMMNYGPSMMGQNSMDQYDTQSAHTTGHMSNLAPPMMPDYNYEERRNSGTTGGSSNVAKFGKQGNNSKNPRPNIKKPATGQYHNKPRRSSNTSSTSLNIPSNDKNVMDYKGQLVGFAKNQQGSKYLQRALAKASPDVLEFIVVEVGDNLHELMVDSYGNYFCQKLLQSSSSKQRLYLLKKISPHMIKIACDKRGTHSMQSLIQLINMDEEEVTLEEAIKDHVIELSFNQNGTHVLQKVILTVKVSKLDYIFYDCYDKLIELSLDANGLCVVKKMISRFSALPDKKQLMIDKISEH